MFTKTGKLVSWTKSLDTKELEELRKVLEIHAYDRGHQTRIVRELASATRMELKTRENSNENGQENSKATTH